MKKYLEADASAGGVGISLPKTTSLNFCNSENTILIINNEGKLFWKDREIETDEELKEMICDIYNILTSKIYR